MDSRKIWVLLVAGIFLIAGILGAFYYFGTGSSQRVVTGTFSNVAFSLLPNPISPLFQFPAVTQEPFIPLQLPDVTGEMLPVIDYKVASDGSSAYILLTNADIAATQVFTRNANGEVVQVTGSPTAKFGLALDESTGTVAFLSTAFGNQTTGTQNDITAVALENGVERVLGSATSLGILEGGRSFVLGTGTSFVLVNADSNTSRELLTVPKNTLMAVSSKRLAFVNSSTASVDVFSFEESGSVSYVHSLAISGTPLALTLDGNEPVISYVSLNGAEKDFGITFLESGVNYAAALPLADPYSPYRLVITNQ